MKLNTMIYAAAALALSASLALAEEAAPVAAEAAVQAEAAPAAEAASPAPAAEPAPAASEAAPPPEAVAAPPAPVAALPAGITAPPEGKGQVVFYRPNRIGGMALRFTVRESEADLGQLPNGRYFVHVAEPGIHEYEVGRNDTLRMEVEPGETYYVQNNIAMGIMAGRAVLAPTDQTAFEGFLPRMRTSDAPE